MRATFVAAAAVVALVFAGTAAAGRTARIRAGADGVSGTYVAYGVSVDFDLFNAGTTTWQSFSVVGPPGTVFIGGATAAEVTARCVPGQPDGLANELACGPLSANLAPPHAHLGFVATLSEPAACGAVFQLRVSSTGAAPYTTADVARAGPCTAPPARALRQPTVRGKALVGRALVATPPVWSASPTSVSYRWQRCKGATCTAIAGATKLTLVLTRLDAGHSVRLVATATIAGQTVKITSKRLSVPG